MLTSQLTHPKLLGDVDPVGAIGFLDEVGQSLLLLRLHGLLVQFGVHTVLPGATTCCPVTLPIELQRQGKVLLAGLFLFPAEQPVEHFIKALHIL